MNTIIIQHNNSNLKINSRPKYTEENDKIGEMGRDTRARKNIRKSRVFGTDRIGRYPRPTAVNRYFYPARYLPQKFIQTTLSDDKTRTLGVPVVTRRYRIHACIHSFKISATFQMYCIPPVYTPRRR